MAPVSGATGPRQFPLRPYSPRQFPLHPYTHHHYEDASGDPSYIERVVQHGFGALGQVIGPTNAIGGGAVVLLAWAITLLLRPRLLGLERKAIRGSRFSSE
jgi:hypothetical protein